MIVIILSRSTMAWGLEARVPFLDKAFLELSLNINPEDKTFDKGANQAVDEDGCPIMEKAKKSHFSRKLLNLKCLCSTS